MRKLLSIALAVACLGGALASAADPARAEVRMPWKDPNTAIVIDAYELNTINWDEMLGDRRIAGFIAKASDGMPESYSCAPGHGGDTFAHCKTMWRKYAVSRELYQTRRALAKAKGLLWGAYHLGRPGNPIEQANHFLDFAAPTADEMMVLDLEDIDREKFISLADAEIFVGHIKSRTGRYPVLYTNHTTAKTIARHRDLYPTLSRLPLWYARYKPDISGVFPMGNWESYALWQFSTMFNCSPRACPYRVPGTLPDIDVNVAAMSKAELAAAWPFGELLPVREDGKDEPEEEMLVASAETGIDTTEALDAMVASIAPGKADAGHRQFIRIPVPTPAPREAMLAAAAPENAGKDEGIEVAGIPVPQPSPFRIEREIAGFAAVAMPVFPTEAPRIETETLLAEADLAPDPMPTASIPATGETPSSWAAAYAPARFPPRRGAAEAAFATMLAPLPPMPREAPRFDAP
jgi:Lyzozyme M1 (1,4-beta-N-acetylmuramidase)